MREGPYIGRRDDLGMRARVWKAGERLGGDRGVRLREGEDGPDSGVGPSVREARRGLTGGERVYAGRRARRVRGERRARWRRCERAGCLGRAGASRGLRRWCAGWAAREGRAGRWAAGKGLGRVLGFAWFSFFSKSISYHSSQNYLNSNEFEFKLLYKQTKQNHAPA